MDEPKAKPKVPWIAIAVGALVSVLILCFFAFIGPWAHLWLPRYTSVTDAEAGDGRLTAVIALTNGKPKTVYLVQAHKKLNCREEMPVLFSKNDSTYAVNFGEVEILGTLDATIPANGEGQGYHFNSWRLGEVKLKMLVISPIPSEITAAPNHHFYLILVLDNGIATASELKLDL